MNAVTAPLLRIAALIIFFLGAGAVSQGATKTLRFEGVIFSVSNTFPYLGQTTPAPFTTIAPSQTVTGLIQFDDATDQAKSIKVDVNGWALEANNPSAFVMNNRGEPTVHPIVDQDYPGPVAPDSVTLIQYEDYNDRSVAPFDDRMYLTQFYRSQTHRDLMIPGQADLQWQPTFTLIGSPSLLNGERFPSRAALWNAFGFKELLLGFKHTDSLAAVRATVTIDNFSVIPEPAGILLAACAIATACSFTRGKHPRGRSGR